MEIEPNDTVNKETQFDVFRENEVIPKEELGDMLRIYMFFNYFDKILEGPEFDLEELYACLVYQGKDHN